MNPRAQLIIGDVRDRELLMSAMDGTASCIPFSSGGRCRPVYVRNREICLSQLRVRPCCWMLANQPHNVQYNGGPSMSIYGEGSYRCLKCGSIEATIRSEAQLQDSLWEPLCSHCHDMLEPIPTPETKSLQPTSIYAITTKDQEEMALCVGKAYGIPTVALRFFNVYGPRQALSNPYTGAAAIFSSRAMNNRPPCF